jgi:hypothetical protein
MALGRLPTRSLPSFVMRAPRWPRGPLSGRFPPVQLLVFTVVGLSAMLVAYAFGLGGAVGFLIFLAILFVGVFIRVSEPLMERLRA